MKKPSTEHTKRNFWLTPNGLAALGLIGAVGYFLLTEHRAHFVYALPFLIFLLCPLMHIFMHGGHGGHGGDDGGKGGEAQHQHRGHD
ncbi:MAG: DUF2933 domain-containing protein [Pseudomonadales bacterium]